MYIMRNRKKEHAIQHFIYRRMWEKYMPIALVNKLEKKICLDNFYNVFYFKMYLFLLFFFLNLSSLTV